MRASARCRTRPACCSTPSSAQADPRRLSGHRPGAERPHVRPGRFHDRPDRQRRAADPGGTIKAFAIATPERSPALPDVPTTKEAGLPDYEVSAWNAVFAPKGTCPEIVRRSSSTRSTRRSTTRTPRSACSISAASSRTSRAARPRRCRSSSRARSRAGRRSSRRRAPSRTDERGDPDPERSGSPGPAPGGPGAEGQVQPAAARSRRPRSVSPQSGCA